MKKLNDKYAKILNDHICIVGPVAAPKEGEGFVSVESLEKLLLKFQQKEENNRKRKKVDWQDLELPFEGMEMSFLFPEEDERARWRNKCHIWADKCEVTKRIRFSVFRANMGKTYGHRYGRIPAAYVKLEELEKIKSLKEEELVEYYQNLFNIRLKIKK